MSYDGAFWSPIIKHLILQSDVKNNVLFLAKFVMRFCKISAFLDQFSTNVPLLHRLKTYPLKPKVFWCRRHRSGTLVENGLISLLQLLIAIEWKNYKLRKNVITKELNRVNCFFLNKNPPFKFFRTSLYATRTTNLLLKWNWCPCNA